MRFPEFKNQNNDTSYKAFLLGEICDVKRGEVIDKNYLKNNSGKYPVISSSILNNGIFGYIKTFKYDGEYITATADGYAGTFFYHNGKFSITNVCMIILKKIDIYKEKYLYYFLKKHEKEYLKKYLCGSTRDALRSSGLAKYEIILPNILEQNKIAQFLSLVDQKIELQRKLIESNNSLIKTIKAKIVSFQLRFKEFVSEEHKTYLLEEICNIKRGKAINKNCLENSLGKYPVISSNTLNNGIFGYINTYDYDGEYITVTTDGLYAGTFFYQNQKFSITSHCIILSNKINISNTEYLYYFLKKHEKQYSVNSFKGSTRNQLTTKELSKYKVILPNLLEQNKTVDFLNLLDKKNELNNLILNNNLNLKKALINLLFI